MRPLPTLLFGAACALSSHAQTIDAVREQAYLERVREALGRSPAVAFHEVYGPRFTPLIDTVLNPRDGEAFIATDRFRFLHLATLVYQPADRRLHQEGENLLAALVAERATGRERHRAEVADLLKKAAAACLAAPAPADLDDALRDLKSLRAAGWSRSPHRYIDETSQKRLETMVEVVSKWQELLSARQTGSKEAAVNALRILLDRIDPALIPRSRLLELTGRDELHRVIDELPPPTVEPRGAPRDAPPGDPEALIERLERVENLGQLAALAPVLHGLLMRDQELGDVVFAFSTLTTFETELKGGRVALWPFANENPWAAISVRRPRLALVLQKLAAECRARSLDAIFRDSGLPRAPEEPTDAYILRVARAAVAAENWEYALRTLEFYRAVLGGERAPAWTRRELDSCLAYVEARRLDDAGQLPLAIVAYREALAQGGSLTPVELIADRLAEIRAAAPDSFEAADRLPRLRVVSREALYGPRDPSWFQAMPGMYLMPRTELPFTPAR